MWRASEVYKREGVALGAAKFVYSQKKKAAADIEEVYNDAVSDDFATREVRKSTANDVSLIQL